MLHTMRPLLVLLLGLLPGCANLNMFSDTELNALGAQAYAEATKEYPEITSGPQYEMVQRVGKKIAAASEESFAWEFKLLKADQVPNAFCLPGGKVAVYSGILPLTQNENGLAAVLGHEVAHATLRHGGKRMTQETLFGAALAATQAGLEFSKMDTETKNLTLGALGLGGRVGMLLPYSRGHESEADVVGLRYAIRAGYDPFEAPKLWERMSKLGSSTPEWLSTHPASEARATKLREMIPRLQAEEAGWKPKSGAATPAPAVLPKR
jgi:predicted Zn-dependent protease